MTRRRHAQGRDIRWVEGTRWRLAREVRSIQRRAAACESRIVTVGPVVLFSTETGDAWVLDPADHVAMQVARESDPLPVQIEETNAGFTIGWGGPYRIEGHAFVYVAENSRTVRTILGYPTQLIEAESAKMPPRRP